MFVSIYQGNPSVFFMSDEMHPCLSGEHLLKRIGFEWAETRSEKLHSQPVPNGIRYGCRQVLHTSTIKLIEKTVES